MLMHRSTADTLPASSPSPASEIVCQETTRAHSISAVESQQQSPSFQADDENSRTAPARNTAHPSSIEDSACKRVDRKIALLKRCGLFAEATPGVEITRACTAEDLRAAYGLVHEIFVERGYCKPKEYGMRLRVFEATPDMATFVAKANGRIVGVLSVVGDTPDCGLPSDQAFQHELDTERAAHANARFCEWSNQVVASDYRKTNVPTELMRCAAAHVIKAGYSHSIISVSPVHAGFYELLGFRQVGPKRSYSADIHDPVIPLCLPSSLYLSSRNSEDDLAGFVRRFMASENPHLPAIDDWNTRAEHLFTDSSSLRDIFGQRSNFLRTCELNAQAALIHKWGAHVFKDVVGSTYRECILAWLSTGLEVATAAVKSTARNLHARPAQTPFPVSPSARDVGTQLSLVKA